MIGSYNLSSKTGDNVQDVTPKLSKSEVNSFPQRKISEVGLQKTETNFKMAQNEKTNQDEKIEDGAIEAEKEENTKKTLKPHHLYVRNAEEMGKMLLKQAQRKDQEKRLKRFRATNSLQREL